MRWATAAAAVALVATGLTAAALPAVAAAGAGARVAPVPYVALGDSYTAAPLVLPLAAGAPLECLRSGFNYPHLTAAARGLALTDRSCSAATTADLTSAQYLDQPPQFQALTASTAVVTLGIGGNDNQLFVSAIALCSATDVLDVLNLGGPCKAVFGNYFVNLVASDGPVVGHAIAAIHALSPAAKVFVVGYPDILPLQGNCYPQLPVTTGDVAYLNQLELALNAMLRSQAAAQGATYVDTYNPSVGHDACQPEATRWIEPLIPGGVAFPIHPNARGEAADARAVEVAMIGAGV